MIGSMVFRPSFQTKCFSSVHLQSQRPVYARLQIPPSSGLLSGMRKLDAVRSAVVFEIYT